MNEQQKYLKFKMRFLFIKVLQKFGGALHHILHLSLFTPLSSPFSPTSLNSKSYPGKNYLAIDLFLNFLPPGSSLLFTVVLIIFLFQKKKNNPQNTCIVMKLSIAISNNSLPVLISSIN